jgi:hypothetical protein
MYKKFIITGIFSLLLLASFPLIRLIEENKNIGGGEDRGNNTVETRDKTDIPNIPTIESPVTGNEVITIDAGVNLGAPKLRHGFLHGLTYQHNASNSKTVSLVHALKPSSWRLANLNKVYEFVVNEAKLPQTQGTKIVFVIQDVFNSSYGHYIKVNPECPTDKKNCFRSYSDFKTAWINLVDKFMKTVSENNLTIDYFDVFAEPTSGQSKLDGLTTNDLADIFKSTHDIIRSYRPPRE